LHLVGYTYDALTHKRKEASNSVEDNIWA
jgi:hypothetical protein